MIAADILMIAVPMLSAAFLIFLVLVERKAIRAIDTRMSDAVQETLASIDRTQRLVESLEDENARLREENTILKGGGPYR